METVILAIHIVIVVALVLVILVQRTSSDGLSGLGGGSSQGAIFSARGSANFLTRATSFLATGFIATSLILAYLNSHRDGGTSIADKIAAEQKGKPAVVAPAAPAAKPNAAAPVAAKPAEPAKPAAPAVPLAQ